MGASWEAEHRYGPRVHVLEDAWLMTAMARIGSPSVSHPELLSLLRTVYHALTLAACGRELPVVGAEIPTRMSDEHPGEGVFRGNVLDPKARVVVCDVIRGGIVPSQVCFELLAEVLPFESTRLDHLNMARVSDENGHVTGVDLSGSKVGGSVQGDTLIIPDPMGATGSTIVKAIDHYLADYGQPAKIITMPMISTPEYLRAVLDRFENLYVYTTRVDRGLSDPDVLETIPGTHWEREVGLDAHGYIVPGAGGIGEVLNNSWC